MRKLLIVDDDNLYRRSLSSFLKSEYVAIEARDEREGLQAAVSEAPDLILLDLHLPHSSGEDLCRRLRRLPATRDVPIIFLSGEAEVTRKVGCLEAGADDFVSKTSDPAELRARLRARLRRSEREERAERVQAVGNMVLDPEAIRVTIGGADVRLTVLEFKLLSYLCARPGAVVTRRDLLGDLWPGTAVSARTIDAHIVRLRKKIAGFDGAIETIYGGGYRLRCAPPARNVSFT
jgi:DNA-binding response OmpR family regulator